MNISMIGIDYSKASIKDRELFSMTVTNSAKLGRKMIAQYGCEGCVILSTCNRTELWFSGLTDAPLEVFLEEKGVDIEKNREFFTERYGQDAVDYLFGLTCGMHSQIFGEDQILTQVKCALQNARENKHVDSVLETLFRLAITGAKKVKTKVELTTKNTSVPDSVIDLLKDRMGSIERKKCLVIGNGEIGRLMAKRLVDNNCEVTMTLRQYKRQDNIIPEGCKVIKYEERYNLISEMDFIFSATLSPHMTVKKEELLGIQKNKPYVFIDLAVPRDIDPFINELHNITVYDMDNFGVNIGCKESERQKAEKILGKYNKEFIEWYHNREYIKVIHRIGTATGEIADAKLTKEYKKIIISPKDETQLRKNVQAATQKTVEKLIFAAKEHMDPAQWHQCIQAFHQVIEDFD